MSQVLERDASGTPGTRRRGAKGGRGIRGGEDAGGSRRRRMLVPVLLQLGAMVGIGALVYSSAADWFSALGHNSEVSGYVSAVEQLPTAEREAKLQLARDYNSHMPQGMLRDPYAASSTENEADAAYQSYLEVLRVSDNGVIGEVDYPSLGISLPVYHGTSDDVLSKGVGHLYGSSLPVGGPSTHTVLTSHSGLLNASLFAALPKAKLGDTFSINVLGEVHHYRVDQIETVLPENTDSLRIVDGKDYVTLITCTPIGINSHRALVRGVRVPDPGPQGGTSVIAGDGIGSGFPWWAVIFVGGSAVSAYLLLGPTRRKTASAATPRPRRFERAREVGAK